MPSYLTFPTTAIPPVSYSEENSYKIKTNQFGDGYTQETPNGINYKSKDFNLSFELWGAELDLVRDFLNARGGHQTFLWINPVDSVTYKVKSRSFSLEWLAPQQYKLTTKFEQKFV